MSPACHRWVLTPRPGPHSLIPTGLSASALVFCEGSWSKHKPEFQNSVKSFLCLLLYSVCLASLDPRAQRERAPQHKKWWAALFSCWSLLPFPEAFPSVWAPKRSVGPDPNTCIKLTGHPSSKTLFFLSLLTFLKLHPLTHISSETVLSTGSHCLLLKEAFWPSHDKIENQTNPTVMFSKRSDSVYRFYRH